MAALSVMAQQDSSRVQAYYGFMARKRGDFESAMGHYRAALARDPGNLLARSYMGQALAKTGDLDAARAQLSEIRARGGRGTWAEHSLKIAMSSGKTFSY